MQFKIGDITRRVFTWRSSDQHTRDGAGAAPARRWIWQDNDELCGKALLMRGIDWQVNPAAHEMFRQRTEPPARAAKARKEALDARVVEQKESRVGA